MVPKEYIDAAKVHKCDVSVATTAPLKKVSLPKPYNFKHEVGVDVVEIKDVAGTFYDILNIVDYGTTMQQAGIVRVGEHNGSLVHPVASTSFTEVGFGHMADQRLLQLTAGHTTEECSHRL